MVTTLRRSLRRFATAEIILSYDTDFDVWIRLASFKVYKLDIANSFFGKSLSPDSQPSYCSCCSDCPSYWPNAVGGPRKISRLSCRISTLCGRFGPNYSTPSTGHGTSSSTRSHWGWAILLPFVCRSPAIWTRNPSDLSVELLYLVFLTLKFLFLIVIRVMLGESAIYSHRKKIM